MYQWTGKGYKFVEYDDPEPVVWRHLCECGCCLPDKPQTVALVDEWEDVPYTFEGHRFVDRIPMPRKASQDEIRMRAEGLYWTEPEWICPGCGEVFGVDQMILDEDPQLIRRPSVVPRKDRSHSDR